MNKNLYDEVEDLKKISDTENNLNNEEITDIINAFKDYTFDEKPKY